MRILVTGSQGAVGRPLVRELRERGHSVWGLDRGHAEGPDYVRCDVGEFRQLEAALRRFPVDLVYHAAAEFGRWNGEDYYEQLWRTNAVGTKNVLRLQEAEGFRLVFFSSSEVYGDYAGVMSEEVLDEHPIRQLNDYAISKWVNELQVRNSQDRFGTQTVRVRLFNTYGPGEYYSEYRSVICRFVYCAHQRLPYTVYLKHHRTSSYIDDTARTLANIAERFTPGRVYNIAGSRYHDIRELSDLVLRTAGRDDGLVRYEEIEQHNTLDKRVDATRAADELGHHETVGLEEGIARTVAWQREVYGVRD
jgi:dTDP-glucose 4,6-dehydratase